jgi:hypothetical protein
MVKGCIFAHQNLYKNNFEFCVDALCPKLLVKLSNKYKNTSMNVGTMVLSWCVCVDLVSVEKGSFVER